jgi:flavodoxin I
MSQAIIVFGSTTGNTEILAYKISEGLKTGGVEVTVKDVVNTDVEDLVDYDLIVLGCSTWGLGDLQDDFIDFYDNLTGLPSLEGKKAAVFGPGDSTIYPDTFCDAVDMIDNRLRELGAELIIERLKVDADIDGALPDALEWGRAITDRL